MPIRRGSDRNRLLARRIKQPFRLQFGLELLERDQQRARALGLKILGGNLQLAAIFINGDPPAQHHLHAIFGTKAQEPRLRPEHHHAYLRILVFQSEIKMPGIVRAEIRNLAFHPGIAIFPFNMRADRRHQIAHRPYAAIHRLETESELVGRRHCCGVYRKEPSAFSTQHSAVEAGPFRLEADLAAAGS